MKVSNKLWGSDILNESNSNFFATKSVTKTIYDPCPYGYHMPQQDVWTNFLTTANGYSTSTASEFNVVDDDKVVSSDAQGFMHSTFPVFGRRFLTTGNAAVSGESNVAFYPWQPVVVSMTKHLVTLEVQLYVGPPRHTIILI